jgi:hypothetical protein
MGCKFIEVGHELAILRGVLSSAAAGIKAIKG